MEAQAGESFVPTGRVLITDEPASESSESSESSASLTEDELLGDERISELAMVEQPASPTPEEPLSYPERNLPPQTGLPLPLASTCCLLRTMPQQPEALYVPPESLFDDIVRQEADRISQSAAQNRTVYDSLAAVTSQPAPMEQELPAFYTPTGPSDTTLVFESRFESGNLRRAVQVYEFEYDLLLSPDYNTRSHTQWYFFRVSNTRAGPEYRFNIINMVKPTSVYNEGMRPLVYSTVDAAEKRAGWCRGCENIAYYQNGIRRKDKGSNYYTLTFTTTFKHSADSVYFAHCYPYTYTDLQNDLREIENDPSMSRRFRRRKLCETLAGNACDLITITSFNSDPEALKQRRAVVITARVHPGETNASWIMKGMLEYLTGASLDARILRDNFVFKIIPMLNPDGVIVGNYRCSLSGHDLNRTWGDPSRKLHPTIFFAKCMMRHLMDDRDVILYVDLHGHSRKKNIFMYGNSESNSLREKIFPMLLSKSSEVFSFDDCCFKMQKGKESTARVVAYRDIGIINSYTLEASFCGADFGPLSDLHFTTKHLEQMGSMVCDAILDFCDPDQSKVFSICKELQQLFPDDGNSDDVSDSDVDEFVARRRRRTDRGKASRPGAERCSSVARKPKKTTRPECDDEEERRRREERLRPRATKKKKRRGEARS